VFRKHGENIIYLSARADFSLEKMFRCSFI